MTEARRPRAGFLALMLELYDQSNPELRPEREAFAQELAKRIGESAEVTYGGIRNTRAGVSAAAAEFAREQVDLVIVACLTYAPSLISLPALREVRAPIVLLNTQELSGVGASFGFDDLLKNHGMHGLHDLANVLQRSGLPYHVVTGHYRSPAVADEIADWCRAARGVRELRDLRIGLVGHAFPGMGDFGVDETSFLDKIGPEVDRIDLAEFAAGVREAPQQAVDAMVATDRAAYAVDADLTPEVHAASSRAEWALRRIVREHGLGALAIHYPPVAAASPGGVLPFLGVAKLMAEGIGFGGEGDVTSAALVSLAQSLYGQASFTEMFTMDFEGGAVFHAHFAEANPAMARRDQPVRLVLRDGWVGSGGPSASLAFCQEPGPATLLNLTVGAEGRFQLIGAEAEVLDFVQPAFPMPHFKLRPATALSDFLTAYLQAGGSHHLAIAPGLGLARAEKAARLMGIEFIRL